MAVKSIAKSYWRLIKAEARMFDSIPDSVKEDVKTLAKDNVETGIITAEEYEMMLGEAWEGEA